MGKMGIQLCTTRYNSPHFTCTLLYSYAFLTKKCTQTFKDSLMHGPSFLNATSFVNGPCSYICLPINGIVSCCYLSLIHDPHSCLNQTLFPEFDKMNSCGTIGSTEAITIRQNKISIQYQSWYGWNNNLCR